MSTTTTRSRVARKRNHNRVTRPQPCPHVLTLLPRLTRWSKVEARLEYTQRPRGLCTCGWDSGNNHRSTDEVVEAHALHVEDEA